VLEQLITSRTRIKMLLNFFSNSNSTSYLRELAEEFGESTNSIRLELNKLSKAGYLTSISKGRTTEYRANITHLLFVEIKKLVHKYLVIDTIVEDIVNKVVAKLGEVFFFFITGDYDKGKDSGAIDVVFVGDVDQRYLGICVERAESLIYRKIKTIVLSLSEFKFNQAHFKVEKAIVLWGQE
jgi:predicted transcriptional regulator